MVNIHEVKANLSAYLEAVAGGERVLICKRNHPIAELVPVPASRVGPRPVGLATGTFVISDAFFEPLPDDILDAFDGIATGQASRVAERPAAPYRPRRRAGKRNA